MALTGWRDRPALGPPAPLVPRLDDIAATIAQRSAELGTPVAVDPLAKLVERAAIAGFERNGQESCGGATRLLGTADGWIALALARPDDVELLRPGSSWKTRLLRILGHGHRRGRIPPGCRAGGPGCPRRAPRSSAAGRVARRPHCAGATRAAACRGQAGRRAPHRRTCNWSCSTSARSGRAVVHVAPAQAGAGVIKVESTARPDGARRRTAVFFELLNGSKQSVALDLRSPAGRGLLRALISAADVVVELLPPPCARPAGHRRGWRHSIRPSQGLGFDHRARPDRPRPRSRRLR